MELLGFLLAREYIKPNEFVYHGMKMDENIRQKKREEIKKAIDRMSKIFNMEHIVVFSDKNEIVKELLVENPSLYQYKNILLPFVGENAFTFGYVAQYVCNKYMDGIICMCSSEAMPEDLAILRDTINKYIKLAFKEDKLIILRAGEATPLDGYLETRKVRFFIWKASTFLNTIFEYLPQTADGLEKVRVCIGNSDEVERLNEIYHEMPEVNMELAIFSRAFNVVERKLKIDSFGSVHEELAIKEDSLFDEM